MAKSGGTFQPGQSGNPGGRPSKRRKELDELLAAEFTDAKRRAVIRALIDDATSDLFEVRHEARKTLLAYAFGKPVERKEISGPDGDPIAFVDIKQRLLHRLAQETAADEADSDPGEFES
jgi:hypothetical protein